MAVSVACIGDNCIDRYLGGVQVAQVGGLCRQRRGGTGPQRLRDAIFRRRR